MVCAINDEWVCAVRSRYSSPIDHACIGMSFFGRHSQLNGFFKEYIRFFGRSPNILYIGVGSDDLKYDACASGPFELSALFESEGRLDYKMALLDVRKCALEAAKEMEKVFCSESLLTYKSDVWRDYIAATGQNLDDCVKEADIPSSFKAKRDNGEIKFIEADIVKKNLSEYGRFDMVLCFNVLCHINVKLKSAATLALCNLASCLKDDGVLVAEDGHDSRMFYGEIDPTNVFLKKRLLSEGGSVPLKVLREVEISGVESFLFLKKEL